MFLNHFLYFGKSGHSAHIAKSDPAYTVSDIRHFVFVCIILWLVRLKLVCDTGDHQVTLMIKIIEFGVLSTISHRVGGSWVIRPTTKQTSKTGQGVCTPHIFQ